MGKLGLRAAACIGLIATAVASAVAQEVSPPVPDRGTDRVPPIRLPGERKAAKPFDPRAEGFRGALFGDYFASRPSGDEVVIYAVGGTSQPVWVKVPGMELRCDSVVIWGDRDRLRQTLRPREDAADGGAGSGTPDDILGGVIHAVYAEGNVFLRRTTHLVEADRVMVDFATDRAYMVNVSLRGTMGAGRDGGKLPLSVRADVIRGVARDRYRAEDASFSTSRYYDPQVDFQSSWLEVDLSEESAHFETAWWPKVRVDTYLGDSTPLLILPKLGGRLFDARPLADVSYQSSSRFGSSVLVAWAGDLKSGDEQKVASWKLHTDYRAKRGLGTGIDLRLDLPKREGGGPRDRAELTTYFQNDASDFDSFSDLPFDGRRGGNSPNQRGRAHLWFRHHVTDANASPLAGLVGNGWLLDGEVSYYSDRGFLPEYFREETLTKKQQETFLRLGRTWGNEGISLFASYVANGESAALARSSADLFLTDYQVQTQYLPSVTYHMINKPLYDGTDDLPPVNLSIEASASNVARRYDDLLDRRIRKFTGRRAQTVRRGDVETRLTFPFELGPVQITPATGASFMAVDDANGFGRNNFVGRNGGAESRTSGFTALRMGTEFHRTFDTRDPNLDLDGLRHVASIDVQYFNRFEVSRPETTFQSNDLVDDLSELAIGSVRIRNRLQTHRDGEEVDWIDLDSRFLTFIDRGNRRVARPLGLREDFPAPLQRLDFPGEDKYLTRKRQGSTFMEHRLRVQALRNLWFSGEADYDFDAHSLETTAFGARWFMDDWRSVYLGRRQIDRDSTIWTVRGDFRYSDRWGFGLQFQQNSDNNRGLNSRFSIFRRSRDYTIAFEFKGDVQLGETSLSLAFYLNDWLSSSRKDPFTERRALDYNALRWYR